MSVYFRPTAVITRHPDPQTCSRTAVSAGASHGEDSDFCRAPTELRSLPEGWCLPTAVVFKTVLSIYKLFSKGCNRFPRDQIQASASLNRYPGDILRRSFQWIRSSNVTRKTTFETYKSPRPERQQTSSIIYLSGYSGTHRSDWERSSQLFQRRLDCFQEPNQPQSAKGKETGNYTKLSGSASDCSLGISKHISEGKKQQQKLHYKSHREECEIPTPPLKLSSLNAEAHQV